MSETLFIDGPVGQLELTTDSLNTEAVAVLCHPHSQYGGSMHDSVLAVLADACLGADIGVVRFNFRSVGNSEGQFDQGEGEIADVQAVVDWVQSEYPEAAITLGGYSFGAAMALLAAARRQPSPERLLLVAPPIQMVQSDAALTIPMRAIFGGRDTIVSATAAAQYFSPKQMAVIPQADHFFSGVYADLRSQAREFLNSD